MFGKLLGYSEKRTSESLFSSYYRHCIKKKVTLKNGWHGVLLTNGFIHLAPGGDECKTQKNITSGGIVAFNESEDGKFELVKKNGARVIYDKKGQRLSAFNVGNKLFWNGCYVATNGKGKAFYDAAKRLVASDVLKAEVYRDGFYYLVTDGSGVGSGLFDEKGRIFFLSRNLRFERFKNGWFLDGTELYDNLGDPVLASSKRYANREILRLFGRLMPMR